MVTTLKYISISQKSAQTQDRAYYHFDDNLRRALAKRIQSTFPDITGLMLLATCNRTELYYESSQTSAEVLRDYFIDLFNPFHPNQKALFELSNDSLVSAKHLLAVANGLESAVIGDGQILAQIKEAYHFTLSRKMQGSLLERVVQAVFKSHKRISNETSFRNGSRSTSYRALKLIEQHFGKELLSHKKLLIIGAGEINTEVLKYLHKFPFKEVSITNRTASKAEHLAEVYDLKTIPWQQVEDHQLEEYEVIITAVSNRKHLIYQPGPHEQVLVDLALPSNVSNELEKHPGTTLYNLDQVTEQIEESDAMRQEAISRVNTIIDEEITNYNRWLGQSNLRQILRDYKLQTKAIILESIHQTSSLNMSEASINALADTITNKLVRQSAKALQESVASTKDHGETHPNSSLKVA